MTTYVDRPWWRPDHAESIGRLIQKIPQYYEAIKNFAEDPKNSEFTEGFRDDYRDIYILEPHREKEVKRTGTAEEIDLKRQIKINNIKNALDYVFGNSLVMTTLKKDFNVDLARKLHRIIGDGLIDNLGEYRTIPVHPEDYEHVKFLHPDKIPNHMDTLFAEVNKEIEANREDWYESAMKFFRDFLYIHPFKNGNGRVARILLSALLINYSIVPLDLFTRKNECNKAYLNSLSESHAFKDDKPITSLIIQSVHDTLELCAIGLEIPVNFE